MRVLDYSFEIAPPVKPHASAQITLRQGHKNESDILGETLDLHSLTSAQCLFPPPLLDPLLSYIYICSLRSVDKTNRALQACAGLSYTRTSLSLNLVSTVSKYMYPPITALSDDLQADKKDIPNPNTGITTYTGMGRSCLCVHHFAWLR